VGTKYAVFVDSGTSAVDLAVKLLLHKKIWRKGMEVYVPSLTFTSTAEVVVHNGLKLRFADVSLDDFCVRFDVDKYPMSIPVHLLGNRAQVPSYIYDSAHRIEKDDVLNSSSLWCYSFYATKNMTTIQGGMIALNDEKEAIWLKKARDHGISKGTTERYKDGQWAYSIDFVGWREKSDDLHASLGLIQLAKLDAMNAERKRVISRYNEGLGLKRVGNHLYPVLVDKRPEFIEFMKNAGIQVGVHFLPLHKMPAYKKYARKVSLPNTDYLGERLVSLPLFPSLTNEEIDYIITKVKESKLFINA
jgi:perosamine synthetase